MSFDINAWLSALPPAFPGAAVAVTGVKRTLYAAAWGHFTFSPDSPSVTVDTVFDLASLTKVVATTTAAMLLVERRRLDLDEPLVHLVPEFAGDDARRSQITFRMLLDHSSGLPAHERFFETYSTREELLAALFRTPLRADPLTRAEYSDLGFILLGIAFERLLGESLDAFCRREIFQRLEMSRTSFNPPAGSRSDIAPTLDDHHFRHRVIQGEVNDENAFVLGGVAGHAGLFAPVEDVARFARCMLREGSPLVRPETFRLFTQRQTAPLGTTRALGWDTPSSPSQSGRYFSSSSFGHLGFTGTSLWLDPERHIAIILLTNRTWPDAKSQAIKQVRPALHDAMMEAVLSHVDSDPQED